jgi:hypothetical protein
VGLGWYESVHSILMVRLIYPPTALEFDPDRFLDDRTKKYLIRNPFIFVPFNAGPRICLGQQVGFSSWALQSSAGTTSSSNITKCHSL